MAAKFSSSMNLFTLFLFLIILSAIPQYVSQPQNIQTFYPFALPPLEPPSIPIRPVQPSSPSPLLPLPSPPPPLLSPLPSSPSSSTKKAVGTAIGATAAGALVLSGIFFVIVRYSRSRSERGTAAATNPYTDPYPNLHASKPADLQDELPVFGGKVKGVIVDEEGLDVLYWRKLEGGDAKGSFKRQVFSNMADGENVEEKRMTIRGNSRKKPGTPIHEIPLLRGKSSTSQDPAWAEALAIPTSAAVVIKSLEKRDSLTQPQSRSPPLTPSPPPPPPPPPLPVQAISKAPSAPTQAILPVQPISKASRAPPAHPSPPPAAPLLPAPPPLLEVAEKKSLPPPPPPKPGGLGALSKIQKPLQPSKGMLSDKPSSEQGISGNGKDQVKLKPLHWDKVNANADHSMVWNKIEGGSFK